MGREGEGGGKGGKWGRGLGYEGGAHNEKAVFPGEGGGVVGGATQPPNIYNIIFYVPVPLYRVPLMILVPNI